MRFSPATVVQHLITAGLNDCYRPSAVPDPEPTTPFWIVCVSRTPEHRGLDRIVTVFDMQGMKPNPRWLLDMPQFMVKIRGRQDDYQRVMDLGNRIGSLLNGRTASCPISYPLYDADRDPQVPVLDTSQITVLPVTGAAQDACWLMPGDVDHSATIDPQGEGYFQYDRWSAINQMGSVNSMGRDRSDRPMVSINFDTIIEPAPLALIDPNLTEARQPLGIDHSIAA